MDDLGEALKNIDIFCRAVVGKMIEKENEGENTPTVEPIEDLFKRKYVIEQHLEPNPLAAHLIPLPQMDDPLIDVFEDDNYVKVLMQCHCRSQRVTVRTDADGLEICTDECRKLNLPVKNLLIENMVSKCSNNEVFEIEIPKVKSTITYGS